MSGNVRQKLKIESVLDLVDEWAVTKKVRCSWAGELWITSADNPCKKYTHALPRGGAQAGRGGPQR